MASEHVIKRTKYKSSPKGTGTPGVLKVEIVTKLGNSVANELRLLTTYFLTKGFVAAHTLPVLYERCEDEVDSFVYAVLEQIQHNYRKLDAGLLSKIPKGKAQGEKI